MDLSFLQHSLLRVLPRARRPVSSTGHRGRICRRGRPAAPTLTNEALIACGKAIMRCFYYWLLNPPPQRIVEKGREAALEITIRNKQRSCRLGFFLNERNQPQFVRLIIPDVGDDSSL